MASPFTPTDLLSLAKTLLEQGPVKSLPTPRRIRILFNGSYVADTTSALYIWEKPFYPVYYIPRSSLKSSFFQFSSSPPSSEPYAQLTLKVGDRETDRVLAFAGRDRLPLKRAELADMVRVDFHAVDAWFEEDQQVYVHPKDPFKRVDILHSTRPVKVFLNGTKVAEAGSAQHLFETGLPVRYYLPPTAVDWR